MVYTQSLAKYENIEFPALRGALEKCWVPKTSYLGAWGKDNPALDQGHPTSRTVQQIPAEPSIHEFVIFDGAEPEDSDGTKARCRILLERVEEGPSNQKNKIDRLLALLF